MQLTGQTSFDFNFPFASVSLPDSILRRIWRGAINNIARPDTAKIAPSIQRPM
jgi:hypothetical protein